MDEGRQVEGRYQELIYQDFYMYQETHEVQTK